MNKNIILLALLLGIPALAPHAAQEARSEQRHAISDREIDMILKAKEKVRGMVNYPDTLVFHDMHTKVSGNRVTLKFTCKNAFGVPETHTMEITVD